MKGTLLIFTDSIVNQCFGMAQFQPTASLHLKIDGSGRRSGFLLGFVLLSGAFAFSFRNFRECKFLFFIEIGL